MSNANAKFIWTGVGKINNKKCFFTKYCNRSSVKDFKRLNIIQAFVLLIYLKITHRWMNNLIISKVPLFWWEKL